VIGLVACAKTKLDRPAPARELYTSPLFKMSLAYAEQRCASVFILSAKYGLVTLDQQLEPYDDTVKRMKQRERQLWASRVLAALRPLLGVDTPVLALASGDYLNPLIEAHLATWRGRAVPAATAAGDADRTPPLVPEAVARHEGGSVTFLAWPEFFLIGSCFAALGVAAGIHLERRRVERTASPVVRATARQRRMWKRERKQAGWV
jgi:hypothetical protein